MPRLIQLSILFHYFTPGSSLFVATDFLVILCRRVCQRSREKEELKKFFILLQIISEHQNQKRSRYFIVRSIWFMRASKNQQVVDMRTKRFYNPETGFSSQADKARLHISNVNWSEHATIIKRCCSLIRNITTQPIISLNTNQFQSILITLDPQKYILSSLKFTHYVFKFYCIFAYVAGCDSQIAPPIK